MSSESNDNGLSDQTSSSSDPATGAHGNIRGLLVLVAFLIIAIPLAFVVGTRHQGDGDIKVTSGKYSSVGEQHQLDAEHPNACLEGVVHSETGRKITQARQISSFSAVDVSSIVELKLERGDVPKATVEADLAIVSCVQLRQAGDKLLVGLTSGQYQLNQPIVVRVSTPKPLSGINAWGQSKVVAGTRRVLTTQELELTAGGQSEVDLASWTIPHASSIEASGQAHIRANVLQVGEVVASGQSAITILGSQTIDVVGSSGQAQVSVSGSYVRSQKSSGQSSIVR